MSELTFSQRMDALEALIARASNSAEDLRTEEELDEVVTKIFGDLEDLENRIDALSETLTIVEDILDFTNG